MRAALLALVLTPIFGIYEAAMAESAPPTVSKGTAWEAADALFRRYEGCGAVDYEAHDAGAYWSFNAEVGFGAELDPAPILVDKTTGVASWGSHKDRTLGIPRGNSRTWSFNPGH
jgi:hypothetical protein